MAAVSLVEPSGRQVILEPAVTLAVMTSIVMALAAFYFANLPMRIVAIGCGLIPYLYMVLTSDNSKLKGVTVFLFLISMPFAAAAALRTEFKSLVVPFCFLSAVGESWYALERRKTRLIFEAPFFSYLILTAYLVVFQHYGRTEFDQFFEGIGRNGYSAILVAMTCGYVLSRTVQGKSPSLVVLLLALALSVPLYGRSSITALALIAASWALLRWPKTTSTLLAAAAIVSAYIAIEFSELVKATNFKAGLESDRWQILGDYMSALNPSSLFGGVDMRTLSSVMENGGSPDISLLRLHSYLGLSSIFFLVAILLSGVALLRTRRWLHVGVYAAVVFRCITDVILLFGTVDLFIVPILFFPLYVRYWDSARNHGSRESARRLLPASLR